MNQNQKNLVSPHIVPRGIANNMPLQKIRKKCKIGPPYSRFPPLLSMDTGDPVSGLADVDHGPDEPPGPLPLLRPAEVVDQRGQAALT